MREEKRASRERVSIMPSGRFVSLAGALLVSAVLIFAVYSLTQPSHSHKATLEVDASASVADNNSWQQEFASSSIVQNANDLDTQAQQLIQAASTSNLTDSIGRALVINYAAAQGQGLGSDQFTQGKIAQQALSQIQGAQTLAAHYSASDITTVPSSAATLYTYGNALIKTIMAHPQTSFNSTMTAVGLVADHSNPTTIAKISAIQKEYNALAKDVANLPTPATLVGFAAQLANDYADMGDSVAVMQGISIDPTKGLLGMQDYNVLYTSNQQLFVNIGAVLRGQGIIFNKNDTGVIWNNVMTQAQFSALQQQEQQDRAAKEQGTTLH